MRNLLAIADDLHFNVARARKHLFDKQIPVAESLLRLRAASLVGCGQVGDGAHFAHATPAAAGNCLEHDRAAVAQVGEEPFSLFEARRAGRSPGSTGAPMRLASARACTLSPNSASASGEGPTNTTPALLQRRANAEFSLKKP